MLMIYLEYGHEGNWKSVEITGRSPTVEIETKKNTIDFLRKKTILLKRQIQSVQFVFIKTTLPRFVSNLIFF